MKTDSKEIEMKTMLFPIILAVHGRRDTEATLHNLRYSIANTMAKYTSLNETLPDLVMKCKDPFQYCLMQRFSKNYRSFYEKLSLGYVNNLHHIFTETKVSGSYDLSMLIYSTYLMTRSPTTQTIDQVKNLAKVMQKHEDFFKDLTDDFSSDVELQDHYNYSQSSETRKGKLSKNNFMYSSKMSYMIGRHLAEHFTSTNQVNEIDKSWEKELNRPWIQVANSSGLRYRGKNFFGSKGHYVVTEETMSLLTKEEVKEFAEMLENDNYHKNIKKI